MREHGVRAGHDRRRAARCRRRTCRSLRTGRRCPISPRSSRCRSRRRTRRDTCGGRDRQVAARRRRRDGRVDASARAAGRSPSAAARHPSPVARQARLPALPPLRQLADGRDAAVRRGARGARRFPHVLVGGKAFHEREEIEAIRAALAAVEWPDDELSVFATLRGPFFAISDEELLEWTYRFGRRRRRGSSGAFHPLRVPAVFDARHAAGHREAASNRRRAAAPQAAPSPSQLRAGRRRRCTSCSARPRAHVGFALRIGGEQALANLCTSRSWRGSTSSAAASRSGASSRSCARPPRTPRRPKRRFSKRTATASG